MIYLRNNTRSEQWLEDPATGIRRRVEADELARVTPAMAERLLVEEPQTWVKVVPIPLSAPEPDPTA